MTLSQLTIIDKLEVIAFCQYSDKLSSYIADTHFQMWQIKNLLRHESAEQDDITKEFVENYISKIETIVDAIHLLAKEKDEHLLR